MANEQTSVPLFVADTILTAAQQNISAATGVPVFATTVTRDAAFGGANKALAEGQLCYLSASNIVQYYDGAAWATVGPAAAQTVAIFNETQSSGTDGGTATSGSYVKRILNTTIQNGITGCSIASSVITLAAGTYQVTARAPVFGDITNNSSRLQNTTDASTTQQGSSNYAYGYNYGFSFIDAYFTIAGIKDFEVQTRVGATITGSGYGSNAGFGNEIYTEITITKVA